MTIRALICDDDEFILRIVSDLLSSRGIEVTIAHDGVEAIRMFATQPPDLVIIDFLMPWMDGLKVIQHIRQSGPRRNVPIILMSAISRAQIEDENTAHFADHFIAKPFKVKRMERLVEEALQKIKASKST